MGMASMMLIVIAFATAGYFAAEFKAPQRKGVDAQLFLHKQVQIANYIKGKALIVNIHITHHAGTWLCGIMTKFGPTVSFCLFPCLT